MLQVPKLACHAAPAQPQTNKESDSLSPGDMQSLLRGSLQTHQVPLRCLSYHICYLIDNCLITLLIPHPDTEALSDSTFNYCHQCQCV